MVSTARKLLSLFLAAVLPGGGLSGQAEDGPAREALYPGEASAEDAVQRIRLEWELAGLQTAVREGFVGVADALAARLLTAGLPPDRLAVVLRSQMQVALVRGDLTAAAAARARLQSIGLEPRPLVAAFLLFFEGDPAQAEALLQTIDPGQLAPADRAWTALLEALLLGRRGATEAAHEAFLRAESLAPTGLLRDQYEVIRLREELAAGSASSDMISALRESVRAMRGQRGGFEAARLLAVALRRSGDLAGAIEVLNTHMAMPGLRELGLRPDFLLLLGTLAGPESTRGRLALRQLVAEAQGDRLPAVALTLLAQAAVAPADADAFLADLDSWLQAAPPHPLTDRMLAYRAHLLIRKGVLNAAEDSARRLLQEYPASPFAPTALRALAQISWSQTPPRYRSAADYLSRLRQRLPAGEEAIEAGILIADCYFLNGDFASASDAYGAVFREAGRAAAPGILYQRVMSEIRAGRTNAAAILLDSAYLDERLDSPALWRAEWNLLDNLRRQERTAEAFARISQLLESNDPVAGIIPDDLLLRIRWIAARLTHEAGRPVEAAELASQLLAQLGSDAFPGIAPGLRREVESHLLLLLGEARLAAGDRAGGLASFTRLREQAPQSGPAILSYLIESRTDSAEDNLVSAQQSLIALVDRFPGSEYAPIALWEAALNAQQRGLNVHLQEAISILERLVSEYPRHALVYFARLKQGDLARRLNDFPTALLLYERLLAQYPEHPERYRAEMSRADCLLALGGEDVGRYEPAAVIYERNCLLPTAPPTVRLEAGFKWAHTLRQQGDRPGYEAVLWLVYERLIRDPDLGQAILAQPAGRYWTARTLLEVGSVQTAAGSTAAAREVYEFFLRLNLPGAALVQSRLDALR